MKYTIFEIALMQSAVKTVRNAPLGEIHFALDLLKKVQITDKENDLDKKGDPSIYTDGRKVDLTAEEKAYIHKIMSNPDLGLPVKPETLQLIDKIKPVKN